MPSYKYRRVRTTRRSDASAGASLRKRRRWYSEDEGGDDSSKKDGQDAQQDDDGFDFDALPDNVKQHIYGLRSEAKGHRLDKRDLAQQLTETKGKMSTLEESRKVELERKGDFETLTRQQEIELTELRIKAEKMERLEQAIIARNEVERQKLPEHMQDIVPEGLSAEELSEWLNTAVPKLTASPIPDLDGGAGGQSRGRRTTAKLSNEEKAIAANMRMTEEEYIAARDQ